jgi:hypothetical protein
VSVPRLSAVAPLRTNRQWLLSPALDCLLVANLFWPVLVLLQTAPGFYGTAGVSFLQLYFVTTPHRWITLAIVLTDRQRYRERRTAFAGIAAVVFAATIGIRLSTGSLTCLLAADYLWNAWHFASQHHGIYRIYQHSSGTFSTSLRTTEKWVLRGFLLFVIFRTATSTAYGDTWKQIALADWPMLILAAGLIMRDVVWITPFRPARFLYLASMLTLYSALLLSVRSGHPALTLSLATASAWFHASEYLAVVTWQYQKDPRQSTGQSTALALLLPQFGLTILTFVLVMGSSAWLMNQTVAEIWLTINVMAAFLHYAYDGMIWKSRAPRTASRSDSPLAASS